MGVQYLDRVKDDYSCKIYANQSKNSKLLASDALPLPVSLTNKVFLVLFASASYFLIKRWGEKKKTSTPLHILSFGEIIAVLAQIASCIYLFGFFGIDYVQNSVSKSTDGPWDFEDEREDLVERDCKQPTSTQARIVVPASKPQVQLKGLALKDNSNEDIACAVSTNSVPSHSLEAVLEDCTRAAFVRKRAIELITNRSLETLPLEGFDYASVLGQCCEMVIGYVQLPVGVAGPLLMDGVEYLVPMATTEGCLVASTNRGCKAIHLSGGATSIHFRDGMTRAPVVRFTTAQRAAELKFYVEDSNNLKMLCEAFNRTSRFARLQSIQCALAGRNLYMRFTSSTGDAMGMNMISKGVQNVLDYLQHVFVDMEIVSISGNFCADKKATAVNWIQGRGKSVICEVVIKEEVVAKVLKTTVPALVELNMLKNLAGSAIAGALGGFNAHASNIVTAVFIATGQDPAQNVGSSQCITMMEPTNGGCDLHVSVTMPSIEVGTIGGGTQLASQSACLNLLGIKGSNVDSPGANAQCLARVIAGAVLAGELSLMSAQAAGHLVQSHMKYNRSSKNMSMDIDKATKMRHE